MFKKQLIIFSILSLLFLSLPIFVLADGMVIPPPERYVYETGQKAVIFYEKGIETLVLSTTFKGDAEDFAWIIPTPQKPEVNKSSDELFASLEKLTAPPPDYERPRPLGLDYGLMTAEKEAIQIIETKKIDYYDITVLTAGDKEALVKWLNNHEYQFPENSSYILDSYIKDKWYFTAVKIDTSSLSSGVEAQLREGHAIPLQLVFKTDKPVYPLKISSVISDIFPKNAPIYSEGKAGKAVKLSKDEYLTYYHSGEVDLSHGTVSFWFKPDKNFFKGQGEIFYLFRRSNPIEIQTYDYNKEGIEIMPSAPIRTYNNHLEIYKAPNILQINLQLTGLPVGWDVNPSYFKTDEFNHLILSWRVNETPILYINDQPITLDLDKKVPAVGEVKVNNLTYNIGNTSDYSNARYDRTFNLLIDEVQVYQKNLTIAEMKGIYNQRVVNLDSDTIFSAHFDDNLMVQVKDGWRQFSFTNNKPKSYYPKPTNINIILYIFTKDKKQQVADFTTDYAGWVKRDEIKNLASLDNGQPWFSPAGDKYYLTRLSKNMSFSEMTYDLYLKDALDNETVNYTETSEKGMIWFWLVISFAILLTLILLVVLIVHYKY